MGRVGQAEKAQRLNRAHSLLQDGPSLPDAVDRLSDEFSISRRQAYRYFRQARQLTAPVPVAERKTVLSVRLPSGLIRRLRERSLASGVAVSELVARALRTLLASRDSDA